MGTKENTEDNTEECGCGCGHHDHDHHHEHEHHEHHHGHHHDHEEHGECGCGHHDHDHHHHDHEDHEECGCGHHGHHHHDHEDHEECGCGHHDHEHHHDHDHHDHDHHHHEEEYPSLSVTTHDVATVGSVKFRLEKDYEAAMDMLKDTMEKLARLVEEKNGLIGHIKAFATDESKGSMISITDGEDIQRKDIHNPTVRVEIACIIFGVGVEELESLIRDVFSDLL